MFKSMSAEDYISKRVDQFQIWYDTKAGEAKSAFLRVRTTAVIGSALVPVVANITLPTVAGYTVPPNVLTTIISLIVVIAVALDSVMAISGRTTDPQFLLLVERCEAQISAENSATLNVIATAAAQPEPGTGKGR